MMNATKPRNSGPSVALRVAAGAPVPPDVAERLHAGGRALEVDCGGGLGCLALAEAFSAARVVGHDRDPSEIARAQALALASGLGDRVTFAVAGSTRLPRAAFDLAAVREVSRREDALQVLNAIRNALTPEGACLLVERNHDGADPSYPAHLAHPGPLAQFARVAASASARDARARALAALALRAGFSRCELACREPDLDVFELRR